MSSGVYGINKGADFVPSDHAEVWLSYRENRTVAGDGFRKVDTTKFLSPEIDPADVNNQIGGLYQLKLPLDTFNKIGIYNIYIRPKQIKTVIQDIGVLATYPDIRGIILNTSIITGITINDNDGLVGYRVEYFDSNNVKKPNLFRIITSNNKCEPTNQATNGVVSYRFNDNSNLTFLTVSPSSASNSRPSALPYIGSPQDTIILTNTFFNPEMIEIEMTANDIESLYDSINGNQIRTLDNGLVTTYNSNNEIINQVEHYIIKESATGAPVYEVKENKTNIIAQDYKNITSNV
jgi:hypothetical protein